MRTYKQLIICCGSGAVSFWLRIGAFSLFIIVMFFVVRAAINRQAAEEALEDQPSGETLQETVPQ